MTEIKDLSASSELKAGDVFYMKYKYNGGLWMKAAAIALFENRLKLQPRFELISSEYGDEYATLKFRVKHNEDVGSWEKFTIGYMDVTIKALSAFLLLGFVLEKAWIIIEKTAEIVADVIGAAADNWKLIIAGIAVIFGLVIFRKIK